MKTDNNLLDPAEQEKIRRGPHEYVPTEGKHGMYKAVTQKFQEYPKMMGTWSKPEYKQFSKVNGVEIPNDVASQHYQAAVIEWDQAMTASVVHNKAEEQAWLKKNG